MRGAGVMRGLHFWQSAEAGEDSEGSKNLNKTVWPELNEETKSGLS